MLYCVYSIRDVKTSFAAPFLDSGDSSAERGFYFAYTRADNLVNFSPADFSLYRVGTFDTDSGILAPIVPPVFICDASRFVKRVVPEIEEEGASDAE